MYVIYEETDFSTGTLTNVTTDEAGNLILEEGQTEGTRISPDIPLSNLPKDTKLYDVVILWKATVTDGASVAVEYDISFDGGNTWRGFLPINNGGSLTGLVGQDLSNAFLRIKQTLSTSTDTPVLHELIVAQVPRITDPEWGNAVEQALTSKKLQKFLGLFASEEDLPSDASPGDWAVIQSVGIAIYNGTWNVLRANVPSGIIVIWSGSVDSIPEGWALCDGTNGTPDLRNRFVVGAGNRYALGAAGGSTVSGYHNHKVYDNSAHFTGSVYIDAPYSSESGGYVYALHPHKHGETNWVRISLMPPYYALCYIMKL